MSATAHARDDDSALVYTFSCADTPRSDWYHLCDHSGFFASHAQLARTLQDLHTRGRPLILFQMDDVGDDTDRPVTGADLALLLCRASHVYTVTTAHHMRNTRVTATGAGRPDALYMFPNDCVFVGSGAFTDVQSSNEQGASTTFAVTRRGDCFEVHNEDDEDIHVNGERLAPAARMRSAPGEPVAVSGGLRANFELRLETFDPSTDILDPPLGV